jgi:hypothetical protein
MRLKVWVSAFLIWQNCPSAYACVNFDERAYSESWIGIRYPDILSKVGNIYRQTYCYKIISDDDMDRECVVSFISESGSSHIRYFLVLFNPDDCGKSDPLSLKNKVERAKFDEWLASKR